jgi:hypothetical protein
MSDGLDGGLGGGLVTMVSGWVPVVHSVWVGRHIVVRFSKKVTVFWPVARTNYDAPFY